MVHSRACSSLLGGGMVASVSFFRGRVRQEADLEGWMCEGRRCSHLCQDCLWQMKAHSLAGIQGQSAIANEMFERRQNCSAVSFQK